MNGQPMTGEYRIVTRSGALRWVRIRRGVEWGEQEQRWVRFYGAAQDITAEKAAEAIRQQAEARTRQFQERLKSLHEVTTELTTILHAETFYRRAVALAREKLGFDRIAVILYDEDTQSLVSTFGVDEHGQLADERDYRTAAADHRLYNLTPLANRVMYLEDFPLHSGDRVVGQGWFAVAPMFDQHRLIGLIPTDDLLRKEPASEDQLELLSLYATTLAHLITRKRADDALQQREAQLRAMLDATTDIAFLMAVDGTFLILNKQMADSMHRSADEMIGQNGFEMMAPDLREARLVYFAQVRQTRGPARWQDTSGALAWDNSIYPILASSGEVEAFAVFSRNITEERRLQEELQRYADRLEQLVEERTLELRQAKEEIELILNSTRDAIALALPNGDIRTVNPSFAALFGDRVRHNIERILWTLVSDDHITSVSTALINLLTQETDQRVEAQIHTADSAQDVDMAFVPVPLSQASNGGGASRPGILVSIHDITQMKEIERFKARFIADAVHDLATPIAGLSMRLYLLRKSPEKLTEHLHALENQVEHLKNLLGDLRTLSQLDRGQLTLEQEPCDLNAQVLRVFDTYEPVAIGKRQSLTLDLDSSLPVILLDRKRIDRVLVNLISNAINYTPEEKAIRVQTRLEQNSVTLAVTDEGIGIDADDLPKVFERFYRTDRARQAYANGTGLGLAITKEVIEMHGGTVSVTSELGRGSTFTVRLPRE